MAKAAAAPPAQRLERVVRRRTHAACSASHTASGAAHLPRSAEPAASAARARVSGCRAVPPWKCPDGTLERRAADAPTGARNWASCGEVERAVDGDIPECEDDQRPRADDIQCCVARDTHRRHQSHTYLLRIADLLRREDTACAGIGVVCLIRRDLPRARGSHERPRREVRWHQDGAGRSFGIAPEIRAGAGLEGARIAGAHNAIGASLVGQSARNRSRIASAIIGCRIEPALIQTGVWSLRASVLIRTRTGIRIESRARVESRVRRPCLALELGAIERAPKRSHQQEENCRIAHQHTLPDPKEKGNGLVAKSPPRDRHEKSASARDLRFFVFAGFVHRRALMYASTVLRRIMIFAAALSWGCGSAACPRVRFTDPGAALESHRRAQPAVDVMRAEARVDRRDGEGRIRGTVLMFLESPDRVRFDAMTQLGPAAILTSDGSTFALTDLRENRFYVGAACPSNIERLVGIPLSGADLMLLLTGRAPRIEAVRSEVACEGGAYHVVLHGSDGRTQHIVLEVAREDLESPPESQRMQLTESRIELPDGSLEWRVRYEDYRAVAGPGDGPATRMPFRVRFEHPSRGIDTLVRFESIELGGTPPPDAFVQTPRPGLSTETVECL